MTKNTKKKTNKCERHEFSLKPKGDYALQPQYYQVSFCQLHTEKDKKSYSDTNSHCLNCPTFNKDNNFSTPTFILNSEQVVDEAEGQRLKQQHERRMTHYTDQKSSLNVPKPRSKNHYCSVCRQNYGDYLEHIQSPVHKKKIKTSEFNKHILQLTQKFNSTKVEEELRIINKSSAILSTAHQQTLVEGDDSVQIISNPQKKVKLNTEEPSNVCQVKVQPQWTNYYNQSYQSNIYPFSQIPPLNAPALPPRFMPAYTTPQNSYNFSISMNLFLNSMPSYMNTPLNPYLNLEYQHLLISQLNNQLAGTSCNLNGLFGNSCPPVSNMSFDCQAGSRSKPKQVSYIVIEE